MTSGVPSLEDRINAVRRCNAFDGDWYQATYPDVGMLKMDPAEHFERFGPVLRRQPRADVSTGFYIDVMGKLAPRSGSEMLRAMSCSLPDKVTTPAIVWAAGRAAEESGESAARRAAEAHLPAGSEHLLHILDASSAARNGRLDAWERSINDYLAAFDLSAVTLDERIVRETGNVLTGLRPISPPTVSSGPKVTVLMATYEAEGTVGYAVRSILDQSWTELELIVIDDASRDGTVEAVERAAAGDPRCRVLRNPVNAGPYASRNAALPLATGEFVTCQDADDWAHPQRIERQMAFLREKGLAFCMSSMLRMTPGGVVTRLTKNGANTIDGATVASFVSMIIERRFLSGIYGHWDDTRFGADSEMVRRIEAVEGKPLPRHFEPLQLVLDAAGSLTNDPVHGYLPERGISPSRRFNRDSAGSWHKKEALRNPWVPFPHAPRRFPIHPDSGNVEGTSEKLISTHAPERLEELEKCDLLIVTNLRFGGGNCSSTIDEVRVVQAAGYKVRLIHCPVWEDFRFDRAFEYAERYKPFADLISNWCDVKNLHARRLIIRHPRTAISSTFALLAPKISAEQTDIIINNSAYHESGRAIYTAEQLMEGVQRIDSKIVHIAPIGPVVRRELTPLVPPNLLASENWPPTFDVTAYALPPKKSLETPFRIGRHGRDGAEKWLTDPTDLRAAYPNGPDFVISILGGAKAASRILGGTPSNWNVLPFGDVSPMDYLRELDVFAYYPDVQLNEAFGRTVVEAMIAARPVLLPPRFEETFGTLAHYAEPTEVEQTVRQLAADWETERERLLRVQKDVIERFSSAALAKRFPEFELPVADVSV